MRASPHALAERHRVAGRPCDRNGQFVIPYATTGVNLCAIASDGCGWEHVSVSTRKRTPNWREMEYVCRLFWHDDEAVMQLHPPRSRWVNNHPHCLHLWRPVDVAIPLPPSILVGIPGRTFDPDNPVDVENACALNAAFNQRST